MAHVPLPDCLTSIATFVQLYTSFLGMSTGLEPREPTADAVCPCVPCTRADAVPAGQPAERVVRIDLAFRGKLLDDRKPIGPQCLACSFNKNF